MIPIPFLYTNPMQLQCYAAKSKTRLKANFLKPKEIHSRQTDQCHCRHLDRCNSSKSIHQPSSRVAASAICCQDTRRHSGPPGHACCYPIHLVHSLEWIGNVEEIDEDEDWLSTPLRLTQRQLRAECTGRVGRWRVRSRNVRDVRHVNDASCIQEMIRQP